MDLQKFMTVENLLKVLLAIAIGVMLYKVFFGKESYDNYPDQSGYAYPMDYEEDIDLVDAVSADGDVDDMDLVSADSEEDVVEEIEEMEDVIDAEDDIYEYADDENEAYDDSEDIVADVTEDAEEDDNMHMYEDELVEEVEDDATEQDLEVESQEQVDEVKNFDLMYASDVEDGLQESFMLYSNLVGVDTNYA